MMVVIEEERYQHQDEGRSYVRSASEVQLSTIERETEGDSVVQRSG
jgi:hypothetical protein